MGSLLMRKGVLFGAAFYAGERCLLHEENGVPKCRITTGGRGMGVRI